MKNTDHNSEVLALLLQIKIKKQIFDEAVRNDKGFTEVKKIYLEFIRLGNELEDYIKESQKQFN